MILGIKMIAELFEAINQNDFNKARELLKANPALVNARDESECTPLMSAMLQNDNDFIKNILNLNPNIEHKDEVGRTAIQYAASQGNLEIVQLLVDKGADLSIQDNNGTGFAHFAGTSGNLELLRYLHSLAIDLKNLDPSGKNALRHAAEIIGNHEVLIFASSLGITPPAEALQVAINTEDTVALEFLIDNGIVSLDEAFLTTANEGKNTLIEFLVEKGANINYQNDEGFTALHFVAASGNTEAVDFLLEHGADLRLKSNDGQTIVHFAAMSSNPDLLQNIIEKADDVGVSTSDEDQNMVFPIHLAARSGNIESLKLLFNSQSNTYVTDNAGKSIVDYAVESMSAEAVKIALDLEGGSLHIDDKIRTVLHHAAFSSNQDFNPAFAGLKNFIDHQDENGYSALNLAAILSNNAYMEYLLALGANVNHTNKYGETELHIAIGNGNMEIITTLVNANADLLIADKFGVTPLQAAVEKGNIEAIKLLVATNSICKNLPNESGFTPLQKYLRTSNPQPLIIEALGYDPKQVLTAVKPTPAIDQDRLNDQLKDYSDKNGYDSNYIDDRGNCSGWAMLFPYYISINREEEFYDILHYISQWDGNPDSLKTDVGLSDNLKYFSDGRVKYKNGEELFEQVHSNLALFQLSKIKIDVLPGLKYNDRQTQWDLITTNETSFNLFFGLSSDSHSLKSIQDYLDVAKKYPGITLDFAIFDKDTGHAVSVYVTPEGKFKFYDSNYKTRLEEIESSEIIANILNRTMNQATRFTLQLSQFSDQKVNSTLINNQQLLTDLAAINPMIGQSLLMNSLKIYPDDLERLKKDVDLLIKGGLAFDQKQYYKETPIEYATRYCNKDVLALLKDAAEKFKNQATALSTPEPVIADLAIQEPIPAAASATEAMDIDVPNNSFKDTFNLTMSELEQECNSFNPKLPSQSGRVQMVFTSNINSGPKLTQQGIERGQQLEQLATLFKILANDPLSDQAANNAYSALCAIKDKTSDPGMSKLCERYSQILEQEKSSVTKQMDIEIIETEAKPAKLTKS